MSQNFNLNSNHQSKISPKIINSVSKLLCEIIDENESNKSII